MARTAKSKTSVEIPQGFFDLSLQFGIATLLALLGTVLAGDRSDPTLQYTMGYIEFLGLVLLSTISLKYSLLRFRTQHWVRSYVEKALPYLLLMATLASLAGPMGFYSGYVSCEAECNAKYEALTADYEMQSRELASVQERFREAKQRYEAASTEADRRIFEIKLRIASGQLKSADAKALFKAIRLGLDSSFAELQVGYCDLRKVLAQRGVIRVQNDRGNDRTERFICSV